jgi:hypothetical protein
MTPGPVRAASTTSAGAAATRAIVRNIASGSTSSTGISLPCSSKRQATAPAVRRRRITDADAPADLAAEGAIGAATAV